MTRPIGDQIVLETMESAVTAVRNREKSWLKPELGGGAGKKGGEKERGASSGDGRDHGGSGDSRE